MAVSDVEAVLDFLRNNGFPQAASALRDDIVERGEVGSFDFEKFMFPMDPPPPPLRISSSSRQSEISNGVLCSGFISDSSDDFISMGSSSVEMSASGLTNPYAAQDKSDVSSDRLSEFGTARDYHDSDMLNDIYWYNEKDGGYLKCTCIGGSDLLNCPSEDKYITTSEADRNYCYQWVEITQPEQGDEARPDGCSGKYNLDPLCDCCMGIKGYNGWKLEDHNQIKSLKETCSSDVQLKHVYECPSDCDSSSERKRSGGANWSIKSVDVDLQNDSHLHLQVSDEIVQLNGDNDHEIGDCRKMVGEHHESGTAVDGDECITPSDHPMYGSCEDDYEIFDLGSAAFSKVVQAYDLHTGMNICQFVTFPRRHLPGSNSESESPPRQLIRRLCPTDLSSLILSPRSLVPQVTSLMGHLLKKREQRGLEYAPHTGHFTTTSQRHIPP